MYIPRTNPEYTPYNRRKEIGEVKGKYIKRNIHKTKNGSLQRITNVKLLAIWIKRDTKLQIKEGIKYI